MTIKSHARRHSPSTKLVDLAKNEVPMKCSERVVQTLVGVSREPPDFQGVKERCEKIQISLAAPSLPPEIVHFLSFKAFCTVPLVHQSGTRAWF